MEEQVIEHINKLIQSCVNSPKFASLTPEQKQQLEAQIEGYFQNLMFDTMIDNLSDEQVKELETLDLTSPEAEEKIALFSATIPNFIFILDEKLNEATEEIIQSGQVPEDNL
jgi:hypothetical protein